MNGKREQFELEDFRVCARTASMKRGRAETILAEVQKSVAKWRDYADAAGVPGATADRIERTLLLQPFS